MSTSARRRPTVPARLLHLVVMIAVLGGLAFAAHSCADQPRYDVGECVHADVAPGSLFDDHPDLASVDCTDPTANFTVTAAVPGSSAPVNCPDATYTESNGRGFYTLCLARR